MRAPVPSYSPSGVAVQAYLCVIPQRQKEKKKKEKKEEEEEEKEKEKEEWLQQHEVLL